MPTEIEMIPERVAAGAAWLDENVPGWERKIDLSSLDISSKCDCVCGQTVGFDNAMSMIGATAVGIDDACAYPYGFGLNCPRVVKNGDTEQAAWDLLRDAWVSLIKERFDIGALSDLS